MLRNIQSKEAQGKDRLLANVHISVGAQTCQVID